MMYGVAEIDLKGYKRSKDVLKRKIYYLYYDMIKRCYSQKYQAAHPSYQGCIVCERWLKFSNFVADIKSIRGYEKFEEWVLSEREARKYVLDKDIFGNGKRIYSLENCAFITIKESTLEVNKRMNQEHKGQFSSQSITKRVQNTDFKKMFWKNAEPRLEGLKKAVRIRAKNCSIPVIAVLSSEENIEYQSITECAKAFNVMPATIRNHIKNQKDFMGIKFIKKPANRRV